MRERGRFKERYLRVPKVGAMYQNLSIFSVHSVPSYKERSYKERLVEMLQSKEQRLVEI